MFVGKATNGLENYALALVLKVKSPLATKVIKLLTPFPPLLNDYHYLTLKQ